MRNSEQCDKKAGPNRTGLEYELVLLPLGFDCSLGGSKTCDGNAERRA